MAHEARATFNVALIRTVALSLVAGGLGFAALTVVAAWLITSVGAYTPRKVAPLLHAYFEAAAAGDAASAHRLLSQNALRETTLEDVASSIADAARYAGFRGVRVQRVTRAPARGVVDLDTAYVTARARFLDGSVSDVNAELEREDGRWRIRTIVIGPRSAP